ncbi:MAG: acyl-CoA dehydrogenase family protein [Pseudomonadota bacterium]|nr:acyl-CoA dehydrogenase family protein [Pseudomonadota bacterium]
MDFRFTEEQISFRDSLKKLCEETCKTSSIRSLWNSLERLDQARWSKLIDLGVVGSLIEKDEGGLGLTDIDLVLMAEESGYYALPEPLWEVALSGSILKYIPNNNEENWKARLANGDFFILTCHEINKFTPNADLADAFFLQDGDGLYFAPKEEAKIIERDGLDPSQPIFEIKWKPKKSKRLMHRSESVEVWQEILNRGALFTSAQLLGLTQKVLDLSVDYVKSREQFGRAIGSFQAVKHLLANIQVKLEFARPVVYKAAYSLASNSSGRYRDVSYAKIVSSQVSKLASKTAIQSHGAIGYTWESDLQIFMKRIWFLDVMWGSSVWHLKRLEKEILSPSSEIGPGGTFV